MHLTSMFLSIVLLKNGEVNVYELLFRGHIILNVSGFEAAGLRKLLVSGGQAFDSVKAKATEFIIGLDHG